MKILITLCLIIISITSFSQTFSVIARDNKSKATIEDQLKYYGYKVVDSSQFHDYEIELFVTGEYKVVTLKNTHQGYVILRDAKSGETLYKSKEYKTSPATINGYNASNAIAHKAMRKEYEAMIEKVKKPNKS